MPPFAFVEWVAQRRLLPHLLPASPALPRPIVQPRPASSAPEPAWNEEELAEIWGRQTTYTRL